MLGGELVSRHYTTTRFLGLTDDGYAIRARFAVDLGGQEHIRTVPISPRGTRLPIVLQDTDERLGDDALDEFLEKRAATELFRARGVRRAS